ncbi:MAG: ATP-grasp domain-containing protein [Methanomicrobiaceae archaeon]|uniref:Coenzyme gamma-f420-2:l-glutamate ligase n=1 Tax=hydrocarbon metagenome TaxID=938273 RepID=A0A0W8FGZ7_9ZZZZ|nr:ATP-grasp domain-containing protein [Methanomicrobiaceae archaeon]MDD5419779.1 ATP-grasp domain-containing protein [Methanomicrobiaceae archaeon]
MIWIVPKPTDTEDDNSTGAVIQEIERAGGCCRLLDIDRVDPLRSGIARDLIWVCGMKQDSHQFETLCILALDNRVINTPEAIATCASKAMTTARIKKHGINTPETLFTPSLQQASRFIEAHGSVVFKPLYGFDGNGIRRIASTGELDDPPYYLQEYIQNDRDFRVFVIGGTAVGAIMRISDTLTHNIHQGGIGKPVEIDADMREIAEAAAFAVGIDYCGVDLLLDERTYTVLEVNGTPNWHCMSTPIPRLLAAYLIEKERELRA